VDARAGFRFHESGVGGSSPCASGRRIAKPQPLFRCGASMRAHLFLHATRGDISQWVPGCWVTRRGRWPCLSMRTPWSWLLVVPHQPPDTEFCGGEGQARREGVVRRLVGPEEEAPFAAPAGDEIPATRNDSAGKRRVGLTTIRPGSCSFGSRFGVRFPQVPMFRMMANAEGAQANVEFRRQRALQRTPQRRDQPW
jgi:hypothetical protein